MTRTLFLLLCIAISVPAWANQPNSQITPGFLCTSQDKDFAGLGYPSHIPLCTRNIGYGDKVKVAHAYGVPEPSWPNVEFDHLIPLCAGGSNDLRNVWPEALAHAHLKDRVENQVCISLRDGKMTQKQAIDTIFQWMRQHPF